MIKTKATYLEMIFGHSFSPSGHSCLFIAFDYLYKPKENHFKGSNKQGVQKKKMGVQKPFP